MCFVCSEEIGAAHKPLARAGAEVVEQLGLQHVCHSPGISAGNLPALPQLGTAADGQAEVAARVVEGLATAMGDLDIEFRTAVYYRRNLVLQAVQARELEAQVNRDVDVMKIDLLLAVAFRRPYQTVAEVDLAALLVVQQTQIEAYAYSGKYHLAHYTGLVSHRRGHFHQVLLELKAVACHSDNGSPAHLGACAECDS